MIVSTHQPYFAPYPGFFQKMAASQVMVILDDVQFPRGTTWVSRNRFKNDQGVLWLTIPVRTKGLGLQKISDVRICHEGRWRSKHPRSIRSAYAHAPYLKDHDAWLQSLFSDRFAGIVDLNLAVIQYLKSYLQIDTRLIRMSALGIRLKGPRLIPALCRELGAATYLAQAGAINYLDEALFERVGTSLRSFKPVSPVYPQLWGDFIQDLSTLDLILNCGAKSRDLVRP